MVRLKKFWIFIGEMLEIKLVWLKLNTEETLIIIYHGD